MLYGKRPSFFYLTMSDTFSYQLQFTMLDNLLNGLPTSTVRYFALKYCSCPLLFIILVENYFHKCWIHSNICFKYIKKYIWRKFYCTPYNYFFNTTGNKYWYTINLTCIETVLTLNTGFTIGILPLCHDVFI